MKGKLLFGTGIAAGYVLGSRSGRAAYEKLKSRAAALWDSKPVQDKVIAATEAVKDKAPEFPGQLTEAARRAATVIGSAVHRDGADPGTPHGKNAAQAKPDVEPDPVPGALAGGGSPAPAGGSPAN